MRNVLFISLGCDKNLVDSEKMLGLLKEGGYQICDDESEADAVVVNTCCFIHDAREESIETILEIAGWKEKGRLKVLLVTGCLAQRYRDEIEDAIPEVDGIIGTAGYDRIVSLLDERTLGRYLERCEALGIAALVETHDEAEIQTAVAAGAKIIGVNNRNLKDFSVDFDNAARLRDRIPAGCVYVAESGVKTPEDVDRLRRIGADAALIGEALMRSEDPAAMLRRLKGEKE